MTISVHGLAVSRGIAIGRAVIVASSRVDVAHYFVQADQVESEIERLRLTARRYPIETALLRYAKAAALNGQPLAAQEALRQSCLLFTSGYCDKLEVAWREFAGEHQEVEPVPFPRLGPDIQ